jgi:carboxymethylenebutenolidase
MRAAVVLAMLLVAGCAASDGDDYAERMATEHAGDRPVASQAATNPTAVELEETEVVYAHVGEKPVTGFLVRPADSASAPGIIVIQEWWGLNDNIRAMARQLAAEGYVALAVDLYEGEVASEPGRARELVERSMEHEAGLEENLRQAYAYLEDEQGATKIGVIGWCFGGGWSLRTALLLPERVDAAVIYYGRLVTEPQQLETLATPILGIFGAEDQGIPLEQVRAFESALGELGKPAEIHVYEGAEHAFANPSGTRYAPEAAADAWQKTLAFFAINLKS